MNIQLTTPNNITSENLSAAQSVYRDAYRLHETEPAAMQMVFELGQADAIQLCANSNGALIAVASYGRRLWR